MQYVIDLTNKERGYKEALAAYFKKVELTGIYFEFGYPPFGNLKTEEEKLGRISRVEHSRVCARASKFLIFDDKAIIDVEPFGPYAPYVADLDLYAPATRALTSYTPGVTKSAFVTQILSMDLIPKLDHIDYQPSVS